ncbi:hypothetical protein B0E38_04745 [Streptomyces sp. 111WW2]|uniref:hypothetical protein n=1 Tax=Streptomyces sp. 111WW2 TaxID=1945515 RepID=UPI000D0C8D4A|nr:hypothetical protein [Streptomyces sp. 111WW2]PSK52419.1 hypothetical protein B0E38_04745 [Streptomyces sp. 111WW2]
MTSTTLHDDAPRERPVFQLDPERVDEIRGLVDELAAATRTKRPADDSTAADLLQRCHSALVDVLADRDDLVRANAEAGEDLARWHGAI